jgi:hypothetical protein
MPRKQPPPPPPPPKKPACPYKTGARLQRRERNLKFLEMSLKRERLRGEHRTYAALKTEIAELRTLVFALAAELKTLRRKPVKAPLPLAAKSS